MNSIERRQGRYDRRRANREKKKEELNKEYGEYEKVFSFDNLYRSYKMCCKGVGWKSSTQRYRVNALYNVTLAHSTLAADNFKSKGFFEFDITERGKKRHIRSVHISERVVQRCLCDYALTPMFERSFIYDNGACMKGKGIDFSLRRVVCHLQKYYRKFGNSGYALILDFSKYFDHIKHEPLFREIERRFTDERIVKLSKSLISDFGEVGLGIGSQISQIGALMYPNKLDHFIKEKLRIKFYARYMDDSYLIHPDKEYLQLCLREIKKICDELGIRLNPKKTQIVSMSRGFTFLKTRFFYSKTGKVIKKPNPKGIVKMRRKLQVFRRWVDEGRITLRDAQTSYVSWRGHIMRANAYHAMRRMEKIYQKLFTGGNENGKLGSVA